MTKRTPEQLLRLLPNWFIPPAQQKYEDDAYYMRASIVLGVVTLSAFFAALVIIATWLSPYPEDPELRPLSVGISIMVLCCYLSSLVYFRLRQTIVGPSNLYATGVLFATSLPGLITGGFMYSPNLQIIIVVPVWAFLMAGRHYGLLWTAITTLVLLAYYSAESMGIALPQAVPEHLLATVRLIAWLIAISLVITCLFIYELGFVLLTRRLREERQKLAHEASHDPLTGLLNRKSLRHSIELAFDANRRQGTKSAMLYIDLDNFKPINDLYGHAVGDEVLTIATAKLRASIRSTDTVARIGGDEFGVVLHNIEQHAVVTKIGKQILETLHEKIVLRTNSFNISASIGVAFIPDDGDNIDAIIYQADQAMYRAKRQKNHICYSDEEE